MKYGIKQIMPAPLGSYVVTADRTNKVRPYMDKAVVIALLELTYDDGAVKDVIVPMGEDMDYHPHFESKALYLDSEQAKVDYQSLLEKFKESKKPGA